MPAVTHSNTPFASNVFVNGGTIIGGGVADALGLEDTVGISDDEARSIIEGRAAELAAGGDPDTMEALERYGGGNPGGTNPINGQEGAAGAPGSDTATGADATEDLNIPRPTSEWIIVQSHVNPRVLPEVWTKLENFAKALGRPITLNSAYRTPAYNRSVGGARNSMHVQRKAADVQWATSNIQDRVDIIQRAIDAGFTGIGTYNSFMHVDIGAKRQWGPNGSRSGQFAQYKPVLKANGYSM
tara:strand:+ start:31 stop:756 length:726 start_codon:yes stop_codon:yes gene_type:complete